MSSTRRLLIVDACVLIDFCNADPSLLALVAKHVGEVHVATPVFQEVEQLDESTALSLGLKLAEPSLEMMFEAASKRGPLSTQDWLSLLLARENGWTCVSNDGRLRRACSDHKVETLWGLELVVLLVERGGLPRERAKEVGLSIREHNRFITRDVLQRFLERLGLRE